MSNQLGYVLLAISVGLLLALISLIVMFLKMKKEQSEDNKKEVIREVELSQEIKNHTESMKLLLELYNSNSFNINAKIEGSLKGINDEQTRINEQNEKSIKSMLDNNKEWMNSLKVDVKEDLTSSTDRIKESLQTLTNNLKDEVDKMKKDNNLHLEAIQKTVGDKLDETLTKSIDKSFDKVQGTIEKLETKLHDLNTFSQNIGNLNNLLNNVKQKGVWGERMLDNLLSEILTPKQFVEQWQIPPKNKVRVDFAVIMPGKEDNKIYLPIDSKFPSAAYEALLVAINNSDTKAIEDSRKAFSASLLKEAKSIGEKYISIPYTTDFAIMYLPSEGMYAHAMDLMEVSERIRREYKVIIAGPSVISALLSSLSLGFKTLELQKNSSLIGEALLEFRGEFIKLLNMLGQMRSNINTASNKLEEVEKRTNIINKKLGKLQGIEHILEGEENKDKE